MPNHAITASRARDHIVIESVEVGGEYGEVLTTQFLDAEAAIRFGDALAAMGRQIVAERSKKLRLALPCVPYPEDAR